MSVNIMTENGLQLIAGKGAEGNVDEDSVREIVNKALSKYIPTVPIDPDTEPTKAGSMWITTK